MIASHCGYLLSPSFELCLIQCKAEAIEGDIAMEIVAQYSLKAGREYLEKRCRKELGEIKEVISLVDAAACKTKVSKEKNMKGKMLFSPVDLNSRFTELFEEREWHKKKIPVSTTVPETGRTHNGSREMDAVKNKVGVEIQFGKYAFMIYNVAAKMTIFGKKGIIDAGVEIVPMWSMARQMSSGVSHFEQLRTDLEMRGEADIDIPVLILGIDEKKLDKSQALLD